MVHLRFIPVKIKATVLHDYHVAPDVSAAHPVLMICTRFVIGIHKTPLNLAGLSAPHNLLNRPISFPFPSPITEAFLVILRKDFYGLNSHKK